MTSDLQVGIEPMTSVTDLSSCTVFLFDVVLFLLRGGEVSFRIIAFQFKADRLQMIVVAKKYICVATVHQ